MFDMFVHAAGLGELGVAELAREPLQPRVDGQMVLQGGRAAEHLAAVDTGLGALANIAVQPQQSLEMKREV